MSVVTQKEDLKKKRNNNSDRWSDILTAAAAVSAFIFSLQNDIECQRPICIFDPVRAFIDRRSLLVSRLAQHFRLV
jgi:hypothetical protein